MTDTYAQNGLILTRGRVATLTLNRPATRNAMTREMWAAVPAICDAVASDRNIRVLILTGAGERAFCAGADIGEFAEVYGTEEATAHYNALVRTAQQRLRELPCPVIAAVRGACFGGGCGLALACDLRVADETAKFAITPARLGLAYSPADTWQVMEKIGVARTKDMLFTGRALDAAEAMRIGLIDRLDETDALADATTLANELSVLAPGALQAIKSIANGLSQPTGEAKKLQQVFEQTFKQSEFREGYSAFIEKRPANFDQEFDE